jgi:predicted lipoprotein with Yx(FWY)xxD motif
VLVRQGTTILTGPDGKTLYYFDRDTLGVSNCTGACASTWAALAPASMPPTGPAGLPGTLTAFARSDSGQQVAYNGHPLYRYSGDVAATDTKGDGVGGIWHVAMTSTPLPTPTPAAR